MDRSALDAAVQVGIPIGGDAPSDGWAEDGAVPGYYPLRRLEPEDGLDLQARRDRRTVSNIRAADGTLIVWVATRAGSPGTRLTEDEAARCERPHLSVDLETVSPAEFSAKASEVARWVRTEGIETLNVAGPALSETRDRDLAYVRARAFLFLVFEQCRALPDTAAPMDFAVGQAARDEFVALFQHWDNIRWQGPAWLSATAAVVATGLTIASEPGAGSGREQIFEFMMFLVAVFGLVIVRLQSKLIEYHRRAESSYRFEVSRLRLTGVERDRLERKLPFTFEAGGASRTASLWLLAYTGLVVAACGAVGAPAVLSILGLPPGPIGIRLLAAMIVVALTLFVANDWANERQPAPD